MKVRRQWATAAACVLLAVALCGRAQAQVMSQVPDNAWVVLKVKNLDAVSKKVAKAAKELGLDQMQPGLADPIGMVEQELHLSKGVDKAGDLAVVFVDPDSVGGDPSQAILVLVPTSDYKAFVGNFKAAAATGDVTKAKSPEGDEDVYLAHWGNYAAVTPNKALVAKKPAGGLKVGGAIAKEVDAKDAFVYANVPAIRAKVLPMVKQQRAMILKAVEDNMVGMGDAGAKFTPVVRAVVNQYMNGIEQFLTDSQGAAVGMNLTDAGLLTSVVADFQPTSKFGSFIAQIKNTSDPLVTGLPADRKYFMYGGSVGEPKAGAQMVDDVLAPIVKELQQLPDAKSMVGFLDAVKKVAGATTGASFGWVAPTAPLGEESLIEQVMVVRGDAKAIQGGYLQQFQAMSDLMKMLPQNQGASAKFTVTPGAKTIGGVKLDGFESKLNVDDKNPQAAQVQQAMAMVYGPNGMGGVIGSVNDKTVVTVSGGSDALIAEAVAAAKAGGDATAKMAGVQVVSAQLPKARASVVYFELDTIVTTAVRYAKTFGFPVNAKLAGDLPPVGVAVATEGGAMRVDSFVPMDLVKGLVAFGMEVQKKAAQPGGGLQ